MWYTMYDFYQQPVWAMIIFFLAMIWTLIWKGIALWYSGKNKQKGWFVVMFILNTLGILPIIYLIWFKPKENSKIRVESSHGIRRVKPIHAKKKR